ncbi:MAG: hypothetical protein AAGA76_02190 [Pseudomonadota bacterium]
MLTKSIKSILAVAVVATGAAFTTSSANAGGNFGVYIGNGHGGGIYYNNGYHGGGYHAYGHKQRKCNPRRALNKAYRMGVYKPHVTRVNHKRIVVKGYNHGHRAKVVFKRHSKHCRVLNTRGLY